MRHRLLNPSLAMLAVLVVLAPAFPAMASAEVAVPEKGRFSRSVEGRSQAAPSLRERLSEASVSEHDALSLDGPRVSPGRASVSAREKAVSAASRKRPADHETMDFVIYDAGSELFYDFDRDGYFYGFAITFDADVSGEVADVYAELYLSRNGGPWNPYFTTRVFSIFGAGGDDAYEVVTELDLGYPPGDYDVLIELYDADTGDFLTDYGPADDFDLAYLPLEDAEYDTPVYYDSYYGGGGSTGPALLVLLTLLVAWRQRQRERLAFAARARGPADPD